MIATEKISEMAHQWAEQETEERQRRQAEGQKWSFSTASGSEIEAALRAIPNNNEPYDRYLRIGMAVKNALGDAGEPVFDAWARQSSKYNEDEQRKYWRSINSVAKNGSSVTGATIFFEAQKFGWHSPKAQTTGRCSGVQPQADDKEATEEEPRPPQYSDEHLAQTFGESNANDLRFIAKWNRWRIWDGGRWVEETTLAAFDRVRSINRRAAAQLLKKAEDPAKVIKLASAITSAKTVNAVHTLARSDRRLAATSSQFDVDPMLLNVTAGTVELRTGELRGHRKSDYLTKQCATSPAETAYHPLWSQSLDQIFAGNSELISYVQRAAGYSLTGLVTEQVLFFLSGFGGNGKNVVAETLANLMGDYAVVAPMGLLLEQKHEQHPTEIAVLMGARMALGSEVDPGKGWAEAKLKSLTGGDKLTARYMRCDYFEFTPQFKFWLRANHKPRLRSADAAMKRRLHLIPFQVQFTGTNRDPNLSEKLRAEWPSILRWMIDGCLEWQRDGLKPPAIVNQATDNYFADFDALDHWMDECCVQDCNAKAFSRPLFHSWRAWAERNNERIGSEAEFVERLEARGFQRFRDGTGRGFRGMKLVAEFQQDGRHDDANW